MMRAMRVTLAAICLALVMASSADAATGHRPPGVSLPPATEEAKLAAYLDVARSYWPGSRCAGREVIRLRADEEIAHWRPDAANAHGVAFTDTCTVLLRGDLPAERFCFVLAHELGHLAGREHEEGESVMSPDTSRLGPCVAATATIERSLVWYDLVSRLPRRGRGWHIVRRGPRAFVARRAKQARLLAFNDARAVVG